MPLIYLQDIRLNAVVEGPADAPPLLLCHALGTDLTLWDAVIPALSPAFAASAMMRGGMGCQTSQPRPTRWAR